MDNLVADFIINYNEPLEAEFELRDSYTFDCSFELFASGTVWGSIDGDISNQTDLQNALDAKQDVLTAGTGISIENNVISNTQTSAEWGNIEGTLSNQTDLQDELNTLSDGITANHDEIGRIGQLIGGYGDIVNYDASDFATAAQGTLADTALQSGDNITELVNNAGYITGITSSDVTNALGYTPYSNSNPDGFISGINFSDVTTALGYTPYDASNPDGFITGIDSTDVTTALGYTPYDASNPAGYITSASLPTNYVTTDTAQTISVSKAFSQPIVMADNNGLASGTLLSNKKILQRTSGDNTLTLNNIDNKLRLVGSETRPKYSADGTNFTDLALSSDITSYTAGTGIDITSNTISITSPVVTDNATGNHSIALGSSSQSTAEGSVALGVSSKANSTYSTAVGYSAQATNTNSVVIGKQAKATAARTIAIGSGAEANAQDAIAIKGVNNTANTFQVYTYNMLDMSTGLIPDARISSNIARTSDVTTALNDKQDVLTAGTDLEIVEGGALVTLPEGYTQIEYITTDGTAYIDTGITVAETDTLDFSFTDTSTPTTVMFITGRNGSDGAEVYFVSPASSLVQWKGRPSSFTLAKGLEYNVVLKSGEFTFTNVYGTTTKTFTGGNVSTTGTCLIGAGWSGTNTVDSRKFIGNISKWQIKDSSNNLRFNGVPCYNSNNVYGLYDVIGENFYPSIGTSDFTGGNEVVAGTVINFTNASGYITGINSSDVTTALGYTPYDGTTNSNKYISNTANGTGSLTILGTATNGNYAVNIGSSTSVAGYSVSIGNGTVGTGGYSVAIGNSASSTGTSAVTVGRGAKASGTSGVAIGRDASASGNYAIQLGKGTNSTAYTLSAGFDSNNYQLLDGTTGLIPDARLSSNIARTSDIPTVNDATLTIQKNGTDVQTFTANASSNVTCNITVPTDTSDLTNGAGYITASSIPTDYYTKSEIDSLIPQPTKVPIVYYQPTDSYCYNESNNRFYGSHVTEKLYLAQPKTSGTTQVIDMSTTFALSFTIDYKKTPSSSITLTEIMTSYSAGKGVLLQLSSGGLYYKNNVNGTTISGTRTLTVGNSYDIKVEYDGTHMIISYKLSSDLNYTQANSTTCTADGSNYNYAAINMDTGYGDISLSSVTLTNGGNTLYSYTAGQIALDYDSSLTLNASNQLKVVVDQTYNASSTNPQSGIAIASAGFVTSSALSGYLENTATGSASLTILGTATNKAASINIGGSSTVTGQGSIAIGNSAEANAANAIAIKGINNTANSFQVGSYMLLDTSTGLIPDARISTNIARTIDVADTNLSNLSSTGTKVLDGQWVGTDNTLLDSVTFAANTATDYSLSTYLPDDNYQYEVLMSIVGRTGTTSGNAGQFYVGSQILGTTLCLATVRSQSSSYNYFGGAMIVPIGTNRVLTLQNVATVATTNTTVRLGAYRRIGTNS